MKRIIKLQFMDFWEEFNPEEHIFLKALREHYKVEISDDPEYVIYSNFSQEHLLIGHKAVKIFYIGENETPDFNLCDYALAFDWITFGDRYMRLPVYLNSERYICATRLMEHKHEFDTFPADELTALTKRDFCSFVVSNSNGVKERENMFFELSNYKPVNSGGRYLNNIGKSVDNKLDFERKHKFSICFENCSHPGYTTEKLVEAFAARTVPIYWGDSEVTKVFNPYAFVNVMDFPTLEDAIERIKHIDADDQLYMQILSEPALISEAYNSDNQYLLLVDFLRHIVEQPLEKAKRTGEGFWQATYWFRYAAYYQAYLRRPRVMIDRWKKKLGLKK